MLRVPPAAARRLAIQAQRLHGPAPRRRPGRAEILEVARALRCLQIDPTSAVARSHLLVVFSRLGPFDPAALDQLVYEERTLFEYWAHEASLVLTEDLPLHRWEMRTWPRGDGVWRRKALRWWELNAEFRARILDRLAADGPLPLREIEDHSVAPWLSQGWTDQRNVSRMLDLMWVRGHVGIAGRDGGQRLWDLMERCLPPDPPTEVLDDAEVTRRAALLALKALGVARAPHIRAHFTRSRYPTLPHTLAELHQQGRIEPVAIDGLKGQWWVRAEDVETLQSMNGDWRGRTALLSPFDNLLCDRARTEELFGFSHRLEIYTPKAKRRWGYFVLPILHGDRLIGRADLRMDRRAGRLVAPAIHREDGAPRGKGVATAIRRELERLAAWQGAAELELQQVPSEWSTSIARVRSTQAEP
jgi:uncharacterized protein YcaQ